MSREESPDKEEQPTEPLRLEEDDDDEDGAGNPPPAKKAKTDDDDDDGQQQQQQQQQQHHDGDQADGDGDGGRSEELAKFWKAVEDDPSDFTGWTYLLQHVDTSGSVAEGQEAYDAFLVRYPYCYGYWKKYADFEKKKATNDDCMAVFERGLKAISLSADLWIHYLNHVKEQYKDNEDFVRQQHERAVKECGREWRSDKLWDAYVKWEATEVGKPQNVLKLYQRILCNPTQGLTHQFDMFRDFVKSTKPNEILGVDDFLSLRKKVLDDVAAARKKKTKKDDKETPENDAEQEEEPEPEPESEEPVPVTMDEEEENDRIRELIIADRHEGYKATEALVGARWKFEDAVKRPYFHMKPLEKGQLRNWSEYIDFEIEEQKKEGGDPEVVRILFERCLIACALYEEFWFKYIDWMTARKDVDQVEAIRDAYKRAVTHHVPSKVEIHLRYAAFEEEQREFDRACEILLNIEEKHPELLILKLRRINLERRRSNVDQVHKLYKECISKAQKSLKSDLVVKYARFLRLRERDDAAARKEIHEALIEDESNPKLHLQLLDLALHEVPLDEQAVLAVLDEAIAKSKSVKNRLLFAQRKLDFLDDFGTNLQELSKAQEEHKMIAGQAKALALKEAEKAAAAEKADAESKKATNGSSSSATTGSNTTTTYPATNSASYSAQHASQYQQYGSRYSANYGSGAYPGYSGGSYAGYPSGQY